MEYNKTLLKSLENMKLDIYYLNSNLKRVELDVKENTRNIQEIESKNELREQEIVSKSHHMMNTPKKELLLDTEKLDINHLKEGVEYLRNDVSKLHNRVNQVENNQENLSQFTEDLDFKISKILNLSKDESKLKEAIINLTNDIIHQKIKELENHLEVQISKIYDTMYNEILDLKVEIKKNKKKLNLKKE